MKLKYLIMKTKYLNLKKLIFRNNQWYTYTIT
jgi:hypothetical protein